MKNKSFFVILFVMMLMITSTAQAADIIVNPGDSIQTAIDGADPGDTIIVNPGTYTENIDVNKSLIIISQSGNPDDTIVQAADSSDHVFSVTVDNVTISGFNVTGATDVGKGGIWLDGVQNNVVGDNKLSSNYVCIWLWNSHDNNLSNNTAFNSTFGIRLEESSNNNTLNDNTAKWNNAYGIYLESSSDNTLSNNDASDNNFDGIRLEVSSNNNTLNNNTASNNGQTGIRFLTSSSNNTLNNNTASDNDDMGIFLTGSNNNTLNNNTAYSNNIDGIWLLGSSNNTLNKNNADSNIIDGIHLEFSSDNILNANNASSNKEDGISLVDSNNNMLISNVIYNNIASGIRLFNSDNNTIYNNYFNNTNNTKIGGANTGNVWNTTQTAGPNIIGGPYIGGNYWATPGGTGFSQTCVDTNNDGFCELQYDFDSNTDYLPLTLRRASIDIEKFTNGEDADEPEGPWIQWNYRVIWTYNVTNTGNLNLTNIMVEDSDPEVNAVIDCPKTELEPGESMECTVVSSARLYQYSNTGSVSGFYEEFEVNDTDPSHYYGHRPIPIFDLPTANSFLLVSILGIALVLFMRREMK